MLEWRRVQCVRATDISCWISVVPWLIPSAHCTSCCLAVPDCWLQFHCPLTQRFLFTATPVNVLCKVWTDCEFRQLPSNMAVQFPSHCGLYSYRKVHVLLVIVASDSGFLYCVLYPCDGDISWGLLPSPKMFINIIIIKLQINDTLSVNASRKPLTLVQKKLEQACLYGIPDSRENTIYTCVCVCVCVCVCL